MGNGVNPLFIQKKDLNSDRLQLSFTAYRFPKHIFNGKGDRPFSKTYLQWRRGNWRASQTATESSAILIRIPRTGCGGDSPWKRPLKNRLYALLSQGIQAVFHLYTGLNFTYTPYCKSIG